jgi:hypothetical protein
MFKIIKIHPYNCTFYQQEKPFVSGLKTDGFNRLLKQPEPVKWTGIFQTPAGLRESCALPIL